MPEDAEKKPLEFTNLFPCNVVVYLEKRVVRPVGPFSVVTLEARAYATSTGGADASYADIANVVAL
jgi:uncharacterized protein (DUF302 family)